MPEDDKKSYDVAEGGPTITPEMISLVHRTLETRGLLYYSEGKIYVPTEKGWRLLTDIKPMREEVSARGSKEITATDSLRISFTKLGNIVQLKEKDSIMAIKADKACKDLRDNLKDSLKGSSKVKVTIEAGGLSDSMLAYGSPALKLSSDEEIVVRKDDFIDGKTLAIMANKAASDLKKELVEKMKNPDTDVKIVLEIIP